MIRRAAVLSTGVLVLATASAAWAQTIAQQEAKCSSKLAKAAAKAVSTQLKGMGRCMNSAIRDGSLASCPNSKALSKINRALNKVVAAAEVNCHSVCSVSTDIACVTDATCPPLAQLPQPAAERCSGGAASRSFDMTNLGFPGPFCEAELGHPVTEAAHIGECVAAIGRQLVGRYMELVYGSIDGNSGLSRTEGKCLAVVGKLATKQINTILKGVAKCRAAIQKGKILGNPATCENDDRKLGLKLAKGDAKLRRVIAKKCGDSVASLDLCGRGPGSVTSIAEAVDCVSDFVAELADGHQPAALRSYSPRSFTESVFPPPPACGDNVVNQLPNPFLLLGEECDGTDDSACPGRCFPPGDIWECSCSDIARIRPRIESITSDIDIGWTGAIHDTAMPEGAGFVAEVTNCDCDSVESCECGGVSNDSVCDLRGYQLPVCSHSPTSNKSCDSYGDGDGEDEAEDCWICDSYAVNAGALCAGEGDCQAQCYNSLNNPAGTCLSQQDCQQGEVCRGRCDRSQYCIKTPYGAPLPTSAAGLGVCILNTFREDATGTHDLSTGDHEHLIRLFTRVHNGDGSARPCPVCGGFCVGGPAEGAICEGTCSTTESIYCRQDDDCPVGERCSTRSPLCPQGLCNLSHVCSGGPNAGRPCRPEAASRSFGTTSNDCPPAVGDNISGQGLRTVFDPISTHGVELMGAVPCTRKGFELFDCPCPDAGGLPTEPNVCTPACNAGPEFGVGCADGNSGGRLTTCSGGLNQGKACDEDSDCPGSSCNANPRHCVGDVQFERFTCESNLDCGAGICVDACPSGRCVPLCTPSPSDPEEGICAAGPQVFRCSGEGHEFRNCDETTAGTDLQCEAGPDAITGTDDDIPGAGLCQPTPSRCFLPSVFASGSAGGGSFREVSTWCVDATNAGGTNLIVGVGGPGRIRQNGSNSCNFQSLP
ncbi:MAG: hypothetical protein ACE5E4_08515 [Candidatus Binatia bacterium]